MTIDEKATTTYKATSLPGAPPRETRAEAEADEARGIELAAFLAVLPTLTKEQWDAARGAARGAAWDVAQDAAWAACAIIVRDLIARGQFDTLTAPMRAAGVNFDALTTGSEGRES